MTAPAIVLVAAGPDEGSVSETLTTITTALQESRPDLRVFLARLDATPHLTDVIASLVADDVAEAVIVSTRT